MKLLVAIPCLNEARTLADVISAVPRNLDGIHRVDCLVIDDGSTDDTRAVALAAGAEVISHRRSRGVGAAFQTGLERAIDGGYDLLVNIDGDGQFQPKDIARLIAPIMRGEAAFVTASRFAPGGEARGISAIKRWGNHRMSTLVSGLTGSAFHDVSCGFRAYAREAMLRLNLHGSFTYTQESFIDLSYKQIPIVEVPVTVQYFEARRSRVAGSILRYAFKTFGIILRTYRDYYPVRFFWSLAAVLGATGAALASIMLVHYLHTGAFSGQLWAGFTGGFLLTVALAFFLIGIIADILKGLRGNQERLLYYLRRERHERGQSTPKR
ncbi:MAG: glycosyltransferase family 2 protein [Myxococcota bacterium]